MDNADWHILCCGTSKYAVWVCNRFRYSGQTFNGKATFCNCRPKQNTATHGQRCYSQLQPWLHYNIRWPVTRIQKSCRDPFSVLQVHETCDDNPRSSGSPRQPEGSDTLATSCLLHSACRQLKHMSSLCVNCVCARTIRSNNNGRYVTKRYVGIGRLFMNDSFRVILCERRSTVNDWR
jgi:hypothetical protein